MCQHPTGVSFGCGNAVRHAQWPAVIAVPRGLMEFRDFAGPDIDGKLRASHLTIIRVHGWVYDKRCMAVENYVASQ